MVGRKRRLAVRPQPSLSVLLSPDVGSSQRMTHLLIFLRSKSLVHHEGPPTPPLCPHPSSSLPLVSLLKLFSVRVGAGWSVSEVCVPLMLLSLRGQAGAFGVRGGGVRPQRRC